MSHIGTDKTPKDRRRELGLFHMRCAFDNIETAVEALFDRIDELTRERDFLAARLDAAEVACKARVTYIVPRLGQ